jgi:hypothetical protein
MYRACSAWVSSSPGQVTYETGKQSIATISALAAAHAAQS